MLIKQFNNIFTERNCKNVREKFTKKMLKSSKKFDIP